MESTATAAHLFQLVDVAGAGGDASYELPEARILAYRRLLVKGNAAGTIAITAPHNDVPEIVEAGGVIIASGEDDVWVVAQFYSDDSTWRVLAQ